MNVVLPRLHLRAFALALVVLAGIGMALAVASHRLVRRYVHGLAPQSFQQKNQGSAVQAAVFRQPDLLPLYGSSELIKPVPDKASVFFRTYPSGFEVSPVGKAGTTSLILLQEFASIGPELRGRKVAISLSPSWFFSRKPHPRYYLGNFSPLHAADLVFGDALSFALRQQAAQRLLEFPASCESRPFLDFALHRLAGTSLMDRVLYTLSVPLGRVQIAILEAEDELNTARFIRSQPRLRGAPHRLAQDLHWPDDSGFAAEPPSPELEFPPPAPGQTQAQNDRRFVAVMDHAHEWDHLELLLRELHELGAEPLLITMPPNPRSLDQRGVSRSMRDLYFDRLRALATEYHVPLVDFHEHADDVTFFAGVYDHLSADGWVFYDAVLDQFYHGKLTPG